MYEQISENWHWVELQDVCQRIKVGLATSVTKYYAENGVPIIRNLNIKQGYFDDSQMLYLQEEFAHKHPGKRVRAGDVITVHTGANIGLTCVVPASYAGAHTFTTLITTTKKEKLNPEYLTYYINSHQGQAEVQRLVVGGGKNNLNVGDFARYRLLLPPFQEQTRIANMLGLWDQAIALTERRIEAARQHKKGLMQRLLSGRVRFPEFAGEEWREAQLGEFFREFTKRNKNNEDLTVLSCSTIYGIVPQAQVFSRRIASENIERYKVVERGDLIYDPMLLWDASIGFLEVVERGVVSPAYSTFKFREENGVREYFKYLIKTHYLREHYKFISQGTNVRRRKAPVEAFLRLEVKVPSTKEEQEKIAAVLQACDREIELLAQKHDALQRQKRGLMQRLLTGRVRVEV
jgi:type I restriction enzyme S subunit